MYALAFNPTKMFSNSKLQRHQAPLNIEVADISQKSFPL